MTDVLQVNDTWLAPDPPRIHGEAGVRVLDCPHLFNGMAVVCVAGKPADEGGDNEPVATPDMHWRLILFADKPERGCDVVSNGPVYHCPVCGQPLNRRTPTRNYVPGANAPVDEHLKSLGFMG